MMREQEMEPIDLEGISLSPIEDELNQEELEETSASCIKI
jgi:hypothetical protein